MELRQVEPGLVPYTEAFCPLNLEFLERGGNAYDRRYMLWNEAKQKYVGMCTLRHNAEAGNIYLDIQVLSGEEGKGYGRFMCNALIDMAREIDYNARILSYSDPEETPPARILAKCGFKISGMITNSEGRELWEWQL